MTRTPGPDRRRVGKLMSRLGLVVLLAVVTLIVIVLPGLTRDSPIRTREAPNASVDPGRSMALAAGCDMTQPEIMMEESVLDYIEGFGYPSVEDALFSSIGYLRQNGISVTRQDLAEAASRTPTAPDLPRGSGVEVSLVEVRLLGAAVHVVRNGDGWVVGGFIRCV